MEPRDGLPPIFKRQWLVARVHMMPVSELEAFWPALKLLFSDGEVTRESMERDIREVKHG